MKEQLKSETKRELNWKRLYVVSLKFEGYSFYLEILYICEEFNTTPF